MTKITVKGTEINIVNHDQHDYISLSDMVKSIEDGGKLIENWLRNKNTIEFLAVWETMENPSFNSLEFEGIKNEAGTNRFLMSVGQWVERTRAIGIFAKAGRYGGTYAHKDIAFEFGTWISPEFKLLLLKEFQRLKNDEQARIDSGWDHRRFLAKTNYVLHTEAVKKFIIPSSNIAKDKEGLIYAEEADIINYALFGCTARQWKLANPQAVLEGHNIRDLADLHQLIVLSNLESLSAMLISANMPKETRIQNLINAAKSQMEIYRNSKTYTLDKIQSPFVNKYLSEKVEDVSHEDISNTNSETEVPTKGNFMNTLKAVTKVPTPKKDKK